MVPDYDYGELNNASNYTVYPSSSVLIITSVNADAAIYKIMRGTQSSPVYPSNGDILFIVNDGGVNHLRIKNYPSVAGGNIKANGDDNWYIPNGCSAFMIYYSWYWHTMIDWGQ